MLVVGGDNPTKVKYNILRINRSIKIGLFIFYGTFKLHVNILIK